MNIILFLLSIAIYLSYGVSSFVFILFSMVLSFVSAKFLNRKYGKFILLFNILANASFLLFLRLLPYTSFTFIAPLGVSYYTLQVISYLVDVYKGKYDAENKFFYYALYIFYIPHLFIGPITRYDEMKLEITKKKTITLETLANGGIRVVWGLAKKFVIANRVGILITTITSNPEVYSGAFALFAMLLYSIELYSDFSGGIDIVLGVSKIFDINLSENFDSPFSSETIKEFWRRWHISLSNWLKEYIYIPLGGNRCGKIRKAFNVIITFLVSGLWHGANYVLWGLFHGIFVLLGDCYKTTIKWLNRAITFIIVSVLWSFFIWNSTSLAFSMIGSIFTKFNFSLFTRKLAKSWVNTRRLHCFNNISNYFICV